jgi:putative FmdB family regulatory protein
MPIYSFRCRKCGKEYDALLKKSGEVAPCPACGDQHPDKLFSLFTALFGRSPSRSSGERACRPRGRSGFG